ncbi:MAG: Na+/H+ antiporter NhaC family protein [Candidatus Eiseniibacteriota bacterium]|nr:MAG: Na+/H+ antiporter NhaC family protein [Candidatus Eisenbacteria bacterium]
MDVRWKALLLGSLVLASALVLLPRAGLPSLSGAVEEQAGQEEPARSEARQAEQDQEQAATEQATAGHEPELERALVMFLEVPRVVFPAVPFDVLISARGVVPEDSVAFSLHFGSGELVREGVLAGEETVIENVVLEEGGDKRLVLTLDRMTRTSHLRTVPGILTILPPLLAIILAIVTRQVIVSLFLGIWLGATFIYGYNPLSALLRTVDRYAVEAASDPGHVSIMMFSLLLGGMVGVISKSGGTRGIVEAARPLATSPRRGQLATWVMGIAIFFDDYANTLIVGNTMRPITDRLKISREKLAYVVDSTAAPVVSLAVISTWIGYEVGLIADSFTALGITESPYLAFVRSIPFRFYPIFALVLGFAVAMSGRDFGPMLKAEIRARTLGKTSSDKAVPLADFDSPTLSPDEGAKTRWYNAAVPILTVVVATLVGLYVSGMSALEPSGREAPSFYEVIGQADPYASLLWASFLGCFVAVLLAVGQRILSLRRAMEAWLGGIRSMLLAIIILILAWAIGAVCRELHTADFVVKSVSGSLSPFLVPAVTFLVSAAVSFATGTSWGTMAIIMPIAVPLSYKLSMEAGLDPNQQHVILMGGISSVLAGAVFGDHCSPISDTTIMSSMASACDHVDHVKTQLPYALLAALTGVVVGDVPSAFGLSPWMSLFAGTVVILLFVRLFAKHAGGKGVG